MSLEVLFYAPNQSVLRVHEGALDLPLPLWVKYVMDGGKFCGWRVVTSGGY